MKRFLLLSLFLILPITAQPKREFRAAWVATVSNIDWPSSKNLTTTAQKSEAIAILDKHKASNINAILLQVRPSCDAFYQGGYEPLSEYLVGSQGGNLSTYYDPLQFWIDEAHKRGMELHAWFNPYRSVVSSGSSVHASHISKTKPEWNITYGASPYKLLDPGIPEVKAYTIKVIMDVVRRFDIDGVHFDDYFYPYGGMTNQDSATYVNNKGAFSNVGDWRRNNVNSFVAAVYDSIKSAKPWVKFGISPFGIWKSGQPVPGLDAYSVIYCDAMNWIQNKKIDYLTPQMYWRIGGPQDYSTLMPWWSARMNGRHLYSGNAVYRLNNDTNFTKANNASEIQNQIELNRISNRALGFVAFSSISITSNFKGIQDSLRKNQFKYPAITPAMSWLDSVPPLTPVNLTASISLGGVQLQWQKGGMASDNDTARFFIVYRAASPDTINLGNIRQVIAVTTKDTTRFTDNSAVNGANYAYAVTAFDRLHNESAAAARISVLVTGVAEEPGVPQTFTLEQNYPNPFNPVTTIAFTVARSGMVTLTVYDVLGREVAMLADGYRSAGRYSVDFSAGNLASGLYLYRIVTPDGVMTRKMLLMK